MAKRSTISVAGITAITPATGGISSTSPQERIGVPLTIANALLSPKISVNAKQVTKAIMGADSARNSINAQIAAVTTSGISFFV
jgi:hypothetical protein